MTHCRTVNIPIFHIPIDEGYSSYQSEGSSLGSGPRKSPSSVRTTGPKRLHIQKAASGGRAHGPECLHSNKFFGLIRSHSLVSFGISVAASSCIPNDSKRADRKSVV